VRATLKGTGPKALPIIAAHPLERCRTPSDNSAWLFELKADGFRGLLYIVYGDGHLVSRNGRESDGSRSRTRDISTRWAGRAIPSTEAGPANSRRSPVPQGVHYIYQDQNREQGYENRECGHATPLFEMNEATFRVVPLSELTPATKARG